MREQLRKQQEEKLKKKEELLEEYRVLQSMKESITKAQFKVCNQRDGGGWCSSLTAAFDVHIHVHVHVRIRVRVRVRVSSGSHLVWLVARVNWLRRGSRRKRTSTKR